MFPVKPDKQNHCSIKSLINRWVQVIDLGKQVVETLLVVDEVLTECDELEMVGALVMAAKQLALLIKRIQAFMLTKNTTVCKLDIFFALT